MNARRRVIGWLLVFVSWVAIGFSLPVEGLPGALLGLAGIAAAWIAAWQFRGISKGDPR